MDDDQASFRELILKLEKQFGRKIAPFQVPIRENEKFVGFVNAVKMEGRRFTHLSEYEKCEIPEYTKKNLGIIRDALIEAVAETSEEYMERYFSGEEFTQEEIAQALREHVSEGNIVPVMMGSGINAQGFAYLLQAIDKYFPSPDKFECVGVDVSTAERFTAKYNDDVSLSARVFKTVVDPFIGKYSLMKICTGTLKPDTVIYNVNKDAEEKVQKVYVLLRQGCHRGSGIKGGRYRRGCQIKRYSDRRYHRSPHGSDCIPQTEDFYPVYLHGIRS